MYGLRWDAPHETAYPSTFLIDRQGVIFFSKIVKETGGQSRMQAKASICDSTELPLFFGAGIPFLELITDWLLVAGFRRRPVAITFGLLFLTVTYGHALLELLFNVNSHIFPRLILLLPTLALRSDADPWSFDGCSHHGARLQPRFRDYLGRAASTAIVFRSQQPGWQRC